MPAAVFAHQSPASRDICDLSIHLLASQIPAEQLTELEQKLPDPFTLWRKLLALGLIFFCGSFNLTILQNLKDSIVVTTAGKHVFGAPKMSTLSDAYTTSCNGLALADEAGFVVSYSHWMIKRECLHSPSCTKLDVPGCR